MSNCATIIGVHAIEAEEPVHLIELELSGDVDNFDFDDVTQTVPGQPRDNWQAAYDEREIKSPTKYRRFSFYFHYLDSSLPLITPFGEIAIPVTTPLPAHLASLRYESP